MPTVLIGGLPAAGLGDMCTCADPPDVIVKGSLPYTLVEQGAPDELLPLCLQKRIGNLIGGPFNSWVLAQGATKGATYNCQPAPPRVVDRVRRIEAASRHHEVPLAAAALQFPLAHPAISTIIPGALSPAELRENAAAVALDIPAAVWAELTREGLLHLAAPVPA